ncbi:hypothetical protein [Nitrincola alkalilacustris]|uniref:hypothetical protein n=1 Tax=Nitrincola alkalilacustris TaxID=1571224 RepID=UPI00124D037C|nr:hypothetical protein [Nitrincola alkalilacustris]
MRIATLGPAGSNHELVLTRYIQRKQLLQAEILLISHFEDAFQDLISGRIDYLLQCTAHPSHGECVGRFMHRAFPIDCFIDESKPLALLARTDTPHPQRLGLQPATRHYTDLSEFSTQIDLPSIVTVAEQLLSGEIEAGICAEEVLQQHPDQLRLLKPLGAALDVWVLFGRHKAGMEA